MNYKVDNVKNYSKTRNWICGHFMEDEVLKNSEIEIKHEVLKPGITSSPHYHPRGLSIIVVVKGNLKFKVDGNETILRDGDFLFMRRGVKESLLEVFEPTTLISIHTPSVKDNKIMAKDE